VDLTLRSGESLAVIGGSGTGKSVLIKNIIGLMEPDSGSIRIDGEDVVGMSPDERERVTRKFGMLFQGAALFDSLPVWENVAFGLIQSKGMNRHAAREEALVAMVQVGLDTDIADRSPAELSGGMQKRAGLARAMGSVIDDLIVKSVRELDATALSITHDMASARRIADNIAMIYEGRIVWHGPVADIDDSGNEMLDQFIHGRSDGPIQLRVAS
jgi:phospholipid/cholesterol/gamma-HCH transport system ATP-binding protein